MTPTGSTMFVGAKTAGGGITELSLPGFTDVGLVPQSVTGGFVRSLDISSSGSTLASITSGGVVRLWCAP
jgi:hypothetical protein